METQLLLLLSFFVGFISIAIWTLFLRGNMKQLHNRLPPGSMGWPFIGETFRLYYSHTSARPDTFYKDRRRRYGDVFKTHLFGSPTIISTDIEINKFILMNEGKLFESKYPEAVIHVFGSYTLLNVHGTLHKRLYGAAVSFLNAESLKLHFMEDIETYVLQTLESWSVGSVVKAEKEIKHFSLSLMAKQLLGFQPGNETQDLTMNCVEILKAGLSLLVNAPWTAYGKGLKARKRIVKMLKEVIKERRKVDEKRENDILGRLMSWEEMKLTDEQIIDFLLFLILAGYETTSMAITCAFKFLAECPQAVDQLRVEYNKVKGQRLTWEDYKAMIFTKKVINETLRLTNVPTMVSRRALHDVDVKEYTIPKDWGVIVPILALHLNEDAYNGAFKFNPWRWKERDEKSEPNFIAFGGGPRYCAGSELGRLEASIFLYHWITKFKWEIVEDSPLSWFPLPNFPNGLPIRVTNR